MDIITGERAVGGKLEVTGVEIPYSPGTASVLSDVALTGNDHSTDLDSASEEFNVEQFLRMKGQEYEEMWLANMPPTATER